MANFLSQLNWRNATKLFDPSKHLSSEDLDKICSAIRLAPTSFGLQPFEVLVVKSPDLKEKLKAAGWGQDQFSTAEAVIVFVANTNVEDRIEQMLQSRSGGNAEARASMKGYEAMMTGWAKNLTPEMKKSWAQKQCYIGLGFGLAACAELGVHSCPMEGFVPAEFDKILGLSAHLHSTVVLCVGQASANDVQHPKWRFSHDVMFKTV
jgi:nitroreductase / dihydropteridine reductase